MKKTSIILIVILLLVFTTAAFGQQKGYDLFQKALTKEKAEGDLEGAIEIYKKIVEKFSQDRTLAAKAQLHIGLCYEKLGLSEAERAFQSVLDNFPEQSEVVTLARQKISSLQIAKRVIEKGTDDLSLQMIYEYGAYVDLGAPSPDGQYLSYINWNKPCLSFYEIRSEKIIDIPNTTGSWEGDIKWAESSIWSPDSKYLAYVWYDRSRDVNGEVRPIAIRIINIDGSESRELFSDPAVDYPHPFAWSRDGQHVLAISFTNTPEQTSFQEIVLISVKDGSVEKLRKGEEDQGFAGISISPDGKYVAYAFGPDPESPQKDIHLLSIQDKKVTALIEHSATDFAPYWSYDGQYLIFFSDRTGSIGIWIQEMNGGQPVGEPLLVKNLNRAYPMGLTHDDDLFMVFPEGGSDIYSVDLDRETGKVISKPKNIVESNIGWNYASCFSRDGKYMAYVSKRGALPGQVSWGQESLMIRDLQNGVERELIPKTRSLVEGAQNAPRWSPNGIEIIFNGRNKSGVMGQHLIRVENGAVSPVFNQSSHWLYDPIWSPDEKEYYFYRGGDLPDRGIYALNRANGEERLLYSEDAIYEMRLHPDGKTMGIITPEAIKLFSLETGEVRELVKMRAYANGATLAWSADGRYLYFRKMNYEEKIGELWQVSLDGSNAHYTGIAYPGLRFLSVNPNGRQLVFTNYPAPSTAGPVWVMRNFLPVKQSKK